MLGNGFFFTESHNPDFPDEEWSLVYENTTAGAYSENFGWGKYKVVMSGGGGSGAAVIRHSQENGMEFVYCRDGYAGEEQTVFLNVLSDENKTFSGIIGAGGKGSVVKLQIGFSVDASSTYGGIGAGYDNGNTANTKYAYDSGQTTPINAGAWVGGSGGGSTSIEVDGVLNTTAAGGNGGSVRINYNGYKTSTGGAGGSGGTTTGTGSAGGANVSSKVSSTTTKTSGDGIDGYVRIYKSNLKPEPI